MKMAGSCQKKGRKHCGKRRNCCDKQFLLFPQCFQKTCTVDRVPRGSVVKCLTRNPGVLGWSPSGSSGFFCWSVLGQDTSEPSLVLVKPRKDMDNVSCRRDMTEILLKAA